MAKKELERYQLAEQSISKRFRKELWSPFINAVKRYKLVNEGDRVSVCISGGKDSMLMAKLMQMLQRYSEVSFEVVYLVMDPGYNRKNRQKIEENAALLNIPVTIFETPVFDIANQTGSSPCYLCARMRRGYLYAKAKEMGCNKIALGHHMNDVIETTVMAMFYSSQLQGMMPKLHSSHFEGMELIRPLYCVREDDIIAWARYNNLEFIQCACRFTENTAREDAESSTKESLSKRKEIKRLIASLKESNPLIEQSIFNSLHAVCIETFPGFKAGGQDHSFLETYEKE
ncbi:MAG: tRNA 2-thiocytidine biosynthesis protein TtcA [Firmicutes bacterium]|nr:tRNA 2-thiocytidine biosynthesis protein TtcA [Bacillota bacterium]